MSEVSTDPAAGPPDPDRVAALDALYAELPYLECRGLCWHSCGPVDMSHTERSRIAELGVTIPGYTREAAERFRETGNVDACPALGPFRTCGVHPVRPMICRLWGMTEMMRCPFGCRPSRELSEAEGYEYLERSRQIGGSDAPGISEHISALARDPAMRPLLLRYMQGDASVEPDLIAALRRRTRPGGKKKRKR
jgi:Fe-S-cluster containining protein